MKKLATLLLVIFTIFNSEKLAAQFVPQGFNYQAVLRNAAGDALTNQPVSILFTIKSGAPNGPTAYSEKHLATTNELGLANLVIGQGTPVSGQFSDINWGGGAKFLTVAVESAPNVFDELGTSQLMSVPYAQYALNTANGGSGGQGDDWGSQTVATNSSLAGNGTGGNPLAIAQQDAKPGQVLKWDGSKWAPSDDVSTTGTNGGTVTQINTAAGLTGGPITGSGTIGLANTGVTPGTWGSATQIPVFTVDASGRVTSVFTVTPQPGTIGIAGGAGINVQQNGFNFTVTNTGDTNPFDDLTSNSTAQGDVAGFFANLQIQPNTVTTTEIEDYSILGTDINRMDAVVGQVLKWNGNAWVPANDNAGSGNSVTVAAGSGIAVTTSGSTFTVTNTGDPNPNDDLKNTDQADGDVTGVFQNLQIKNSAVGNEEIADGSVNTPKLANGAVTGVKIAQMNASNGQVLKWNGTAWIPANDAAGGNYSAGDGIAILGSAPNQTIENIGDTDADDDVLKTDQADGDVSGVFTNLQIKTSAVGTPEIAAAAVTAAKLAPMGATTGQVLRWNGNVWAPATPAAGGDDWGNQIVETNATLSGEGTQANPLKIAQQGATVGQILRWNGTTWLPANVAGDNWGTQNVKTDATLAGDGTTANPLKIATQGASAGQVLKFNGINWVPAADLTGGGGGSNNNYTAGNGISITGTAPNFVIANTGDLSATNEIQNLTLTGTTLSISGGNSVSLAGLGGGGSGNFWVGSGNNISSTNTGNVGIGTANPNFKLTVAGNGETVRLAGAGSVLGFGPATAGSSPTAFLTDQGNKFLIGTAKDTTPIILAPFKNPTMVVGSKDNVSIGTGQETNFALEVAHEADGFLLRNAITNSFWEFWVNPNNSTLNLFNSALPAGVPAGIFQMNGQYQPSDERLKKDISPMPTVLDKLLKIKPVNYHFNFEKSDAPASFGFLAQDVAAQFPELVHQTSPRRNEPSYLTLNYSAFGVLAVKALQEQQSEIDFLKKENLDLKARLDKIEARFRN